MTQTRTHIGDALDRVDGPAKVTGRATYAADYRPGKSLAEGYIVEAPVGPGRIATLDTVRAEQAPGVLKVLTHRNAPAQTPYGEPEDEGRFTQSHAVLKGDHVRHAGAPVALVVAETLEQARHAARLIDLRIETSEGVFDTFAHEAEAFAPDSLDGADDADTDCGDFDKEFAAAATTVEGEFFTAAQHASAMEPHATVAEWDGDELTVHMAIQIVASGVEAFANTLGIDADKIRIVSPYTGGGFGSKLGLHNEAVLAALAAKATGRGVRVVQTRRNLFANAPHRSRHRQRISLGASEDGKLRAVSHSSLAGMARDYAFAEAAASVARSSYATEALRTRHRAVELDMPKVDSMRAPGEAVGTLAYESAIDELAASCGIDPVEFRYLNEPSREPWSGKSFADRRLVECLRAGAERFGWAGSQKTPGARREGHLLIGQGMAVAIRPNLLTPAQAEVSVTPDGRVVARLDMTDIGTGTYTILTQIIADTLHVPVESIAVELGDSRFPQTSGSGGSFGAASAGSAVRDACEALSREILERIGSGGAGANEVTLKGASAITGERSVALAELMKEGEEEIVCEGGIDPDSYRDDRAQYSYGAQFAEVSVDADSGEVRLRRLVGAFDAGRILNRKTARSQLMGGMIFGLGGALLEESELDTRYGVFMNRDFAGYHIAVNRDVPELDVLMLDGDSRASCPLGSKGIGELGICGAGPAIANAIHDATGYRPRKFPVHMEDLIDSLPA